MKKKTNKKYIKGKYYMQPSFLGISKGFIFEDGEAHFICSDNTAINHGYSLSCESGDEQQMTHLDEEFESADDVIGYICHMGFDFNMEESDRYKDSNFCIKATPIHN